MPVRQANPVAEARDLHVNLGGAEVLRAVSFAVQPGDYVGVAGPNGSGKTTLLRTLLGFISPSRGTVRLFGQDPRGFRDWHRVSYVPQIGTSLPSLLPLTAEEVVFLGLLPGRGFPRRMDRTARERVRAALRLMKMEGMARMPVSALSGGQQQRVLLARAVVNEPELLLLDEPSAALDPAFRDDFYDAVSRLNQESGMTVIMVTHDTASIGLYARRLLYLDRRVVFYGTFAEFCRSEEMTRYFGAFQQHQICHQHD